MPSVRNGLKRHFDGSQLSRCVLRCYGYGVTVRKHEGKRVREDDFLFHHADGWARCSRKQVRCAFVAMATRNTERGGEKWFHVKPELLSLFCMETILCKTEITSVMRIWVELMKKIRASHFIQKGYFRLQIWGFCGSSFFSWEHNTFVLSAWLSFYWDKGDINKHKRHPIRLHYVELPTTYSNSELVTWSRM